MIHIRAHSTYKTDLVGESNYFEMIDSVYNADDRFMRNRAVFADARIILEDNNKYDKNAVLIMVDSNIMGYLSREDAIVFRRLFKKYAQSNQLLSRVRIYKGRNNYSVRVDVDLDELEMNEVLEDETSPIVLEALTPNSKNEEKSNSSFLQKVIIMLVVLVILSFIF